MNTVASRHAQRGLSPLSVLLILGCIGFVGFIAMRIVPIYMADWTVNAAIEGLALEPDVTQRSPNELRSALAKRFDVNNIEEIKPSDVHISKEAGRLTVGIDYEVRKPLIGNIDVVVKFSHEQVVVK
ncbi:DUF4845 domain-containing protein [Plasticicumulans acidivorans]|uniref:Uncharacterized protein DUF4845 n=1 Tax=Plasticicumulans acidivorans TaxID=886464 RepID=A0A317MXA7_9GAMM|nr:DUF4845 domain-containing protein [Plasticicumulans acidivorans]PWV63370.1 uncharacterized protein DUF4845 [Plasticicumulans acidivorans]